MIPYKQTLQTEAYCHYPFHLPPIHKSDLWMWPTESVTFTVMAYGT